MPSRMDKYNSEEISSSSRISKNQNLYKELSSNKRFTEFNDSEKDNILDLSTVDNNINENRRSSYKKARLLNDATGKSENKRSGFNINSSYQKLLGEVDKEKTYNVNDILELARKNRTDLDEEEKRRKLKSVEYSILSDLSQEKLKEYHDRKEKGISKYEEENLEELINTITSKTVRNKIDNELLGDLLPDNDSDTLISTKLLKELEDGSLDDTDENEFEKEEVENTADLEKGLDKSFYTRSMDLKREDLILKSDEDDISDDYYNIEDGRNGVGKTILIIIIVLIIVGIIGYCIYKYI